MIVAVRPHSDDYNCVLRQIPGQVVISLSFRSFSRRTLLAVLLVTAPMDGYAQDLPAGPLRAFGGSLVVSGEAVATVGNADDIAFFNYTDYEHNTLRMLRLGVSGLWQPAPWLAFLGDVRSEDLENPTAYAAYVRIRPWQAHAFDIQAGRIPPSFGAFGRRAYGTDNPVVGYPLAYQYLTSLRTDAVPITADDLVQMRARGWRSNFPVGSQVPEPGVPLVSAFRWDTGVQLRWRTGPVEVSGAVTNGTLSNPRIDDDNGGKQISGRVAVYPAVGLVIGASAARGAWLAREVGGTAPGSPQQAFGADIEYSRDHWIVRGEIVRSRWTLPVALSPAGNGRDLHAVAAWAEGRYKLTPRIFAGMRIDGLGFSRISGTEPGTQSIPWDAPVQRVEVGAGYYLQRNLVARVTVQGNWRNAGRVTNRTYFSGQLAYWF